MTLFSNKNWYAVLGNSCNPELKNINEYMLFACNKATHNNRLRQDVLVLSGGFTDPVNFPGVSEAMIMEKIAREKAGFTGDIYREENSYNNIQRVKNISGFEIIVKEADIEFPARSTFKLAPLPLGVICDQKCVVAVNYIAQKVFKKRIPVVGFDFGVTPKPRLKNIVETTKDIISIHSARLENYFLEKRKRELEII